MPEEYDEETEKEGEEIYDDEAREEMVENEEITAEEEGFMFGWLETWDNEAKESE